RSARLCRATRGRGGELDRTPRPPRALACWRKSCRSWPRAGRESFPPPRGRRDRARPADQAPPLARSRRRDRSPPSGPPPPLPPAPSPPFPPPPPAAAPAPRRAGGWGGAAGGGGGSRGAGARAARPPPLLRLEWGGPGSRSARPPLAPWRRRQWAPQGSTREPCSPKCALNGGRSFGQSPKNFRGTRVTCEAHVQIKRRPGANLTWIRLPRQQPKAVIAGEFGRFWPVVACLQRAGRFFSQQVSPDCNAGAFASEISASSPSESSLR